jgi:hypothetical protein
MRPVRAWYLYAGLLALTVLTYLPVWHNDFVDFDDGTYLTMNPQVLEGFSGPNFRWVWSVDRAPYWVPLTWLSFQLDAQCFAQRTPEGDVLLPAAAVHGQNLFWHTANVLLLFGFWQRVTGRPWPSFLVAALFAVHPMHVESVAWAAERKDVLCVFFGLLALWAYVGYVRKPGWPRYLALMAAYLLSLMAKPMLITLPFVLLLLDYWPLGRLRGSTAAPQAAGGSLIPMSLGRLIVEKAPLFLLAAAIAAVTLEGRSAHGSIVSLDTLSFSARWANALTAYGWYLSSTFYPVRLAVLYPHPYQDWSLPAALLGTALLLSLSVISVWLRHRRPWLLVGWLWFIGTLLPVIGFAQGGRQAWADRFSYWPHIGLFVALIWGLAELRERWRVPALVPRLAAAMALGWLVLRTGEQIGTWRNAGTLWEHAAGVTSNNDQAHEHLARYHRFRGQPEQAEFHLLQAARIQRRRLGLPPDTAPQPRFVNRTP